VVGVGDDEAAGAVGEHVEDFLVAGDRLGNDGDDAAAVQRVVGAHVGVVAIVASPAEIAVVAASAAVIAAGAGEAAAAAGVAEAAAGIAAAGLAAAEAAAREIAAAPSAAAGRA